MSATFPITLRASASAAASGTGASLDLEIADSTARLWLEVTAVSGTLPTLDVIVEHSHNGVSWTTLGSFAQKTAAGAEFKVFPDANQFLRVRWVIGGTLPDFTFSVSGEQVLVYATPADVQLLGIRSAALGGSNAVTDAEIDRAVEAAGDTIDSYLDQADIDTPMEEWPGSIRRAAAIIAAYDLVSARVGYNPDAQGDDPFRKRYEDMIKWLESIAAGDAALPGGGTTTPPDAATTGRVLVVTSEEPRGW